MWKRANEKRCGRAVLAIGRQNERRDAVMRAGVTPAEVHANNATGPRQVTSNQTPVIVTRQTGNMHTNAVGPSVSISPDATNHTAVLHLLRTDTKQLWLVPLHPSQTTQ